MTPPPSGPRSGSTRSGRTAPHPSAGRTAPPAGRRAPAAATRAGSPLRAAAAAGRPAPYARSGRSAAAAASTSAGTTRTGGRPAATAARSGGGSTRAGSRPAPRGASAGPVGAPGGVRTAAAARSGGGSTRAASRPATGGATRARSTAASRGRSTPAPRRTPPRRTRRTRLIRLGDPGRRLGVGFAAVCTLLVVLGGRLVQLQGFDGARLAAKAQQQRLNSTPITAVRGKILDRDGRVLAYTVAARTIFADPKLVVDPVATAAELAPLLGQNADSLVAKLRKKGRYVPLARDVSPTDAARIQARGLKGIGAQDTTQRLYPGREVGAGVIGFTGVDGGLAGIEQRYDRQLAGTPGELVVERGTDGTPIPSGRREETDAVPGSSVHLTLDEDLQYVAQRALADAVKKAQASGGQLVVLDVHTGEVLAMATAPTYDAQAPAAADPARRGNPAVSDVIEPGSANKVVTFSAAVDRGLIRPDTPMSVPDSYRVADRVVHDAWSHKVERWTATGVLAKSSNVGTLMIAHALGPSAFYDYLTRFGIGTKTGIELPAESGGILPKPEEWSGSTFGNLPIGQGVSMTALQLAGMYQTIGNGGVRISPRIVRGVTAPDGTVTSGAAPTRTTVVSPQAARTVRTMLEAVTGPGGTAPKAAIDGYRVAGKTGTAQKPNPACHCYSGGGYWATFAGMAPADDPQLVISVVIDEAKGGGHGGAVAAPLFHQVMSYALTARGVAPTGTPKPTARLTVD